MYSGYEGEDIQLRQLNGYTDDDSPGSRHVRLQPGHTTIDLDLDDRPYYDSDIDLPAQHEEYLDETDHTDELPSRQLSTLGYRTLSSDVRRRKSVSNRPKTKTRRPTHILNSWLRQPEQLHDQILNKWREEDAEEEIENENEVRTARRIEELRDMTINLSRKKRLRDALRRETIRYGSTKGITCWRSMKYAWAIKKEHAKSSITATLRSMGLWEGHLKLFASHFGSDVTAYFLFLRWLFVANLLIGLVVLLFLFIPQLMYQYLTIRETSTETFLLFKKDPLNSPIRGYDVPKTDGREFVIGTADNSTSGVFSGTGMYYGDYTDRLLKSGSVKIWHWYNMKVAYLLTIGAYFFLYFLVIAISVVKSYRKNFIESSDKFTFQYVLKVLDGWDYMIDAAKTAQTKRKNVYRDLREFCASNRQLEAVDDCCDRLMLFMFRFGGLIIMLASICLSGYAVYEISEILKHKQDSLLQDILIPVVITAINILMPFVFSAISSVLKFSNPKSVVYLMLIMTMLLYGTTLGVYFSITMEGLFSTNATNQSTTCWETRLGEKAYGFVVVDFLFGIIVTLISEVLYRLITQLCCKQMEKKKRLEGKSILPQFDIARNTMALLYNQFLLWLGIYYCPLLTVAVVIKLFLIFYMKRITVMNACIPTMKPWRASKMHTIFLVLLFIGFIFCAVLFALAIVMVTPSTTCGPFRDQKQVTDVVTDVVSSAFSDNEEGLLRILISPGVIFGVIVILCVIVHYVRVTSAGRKTLISLLKIQITLESKDKAYLRHMLEGLLKHRPSTQETIEQCNCEGACSCGVNVQAEQDVQYDQITELPVRSTNNRRVFARERNSSTTLSLISAESALASSREDLSTRAGRRAHSGSNTDISRPGA